MPHNVAYGQNGFNSPPMINTGGPTSPGMSSGGIPSPGSVHSPSPPVMQVRLFLPLKQNQPIKNSSNFNAKSISRQTYKDRQLSCVSKIKKIIVRIIKGRLNTA